MNWNKLKAAVNLLPSGNDNFLVNFVFRMFKACLSRKGWCVEPHMPDRFNLK